MMYSMCHNSGVASRTPSAKLTMKRLISNMTFLIENTPFVFLISQSVSLAARRLSFSKFNGHTTLRKKPRGKEKTVSVPSTPSFLPQTSESRDEILLSGGELSEPSVRYVLGSRFNLHSSQQFKIQMKWEKDPPR